MANERGAVEIYGVGKEFDGTLVVNTQKVLRQLARLSKDLTNLLNTYFQGSVNRASRMALRLILAYHHVSSRTSVLRKICFILERS